MVKNNPNIKELKIGNNHPYSNDYMMELMKALSTNTSLRVLDIDNVDLNKDFFEFLKTN